jgi:hypothetical protein
MDDKSKISVQEHRKQGDTPIKQSNCAVAAQMYSYLSMENGEHACSNYITWLLKKKNHDGL